MSLEVIHFPLTITGARHRPHLTARLSVWLADCQTTWRRIGRLAVWRAGDHEQRSPIYLTRMAPHAESSPTHFDFRLEAYQINASRSAIVDKGLEKGIKFHSDGTWITSKQVASDSVLCSDLYIFSVATKSISLQSLQEIL